MINKGIITDLHNKVSELNDMITDYKEKITVIDNAILAIKTKKSKLVTAKGDLQGARTLMQSATENFRENYNGSDTAEKKLAQMREIKNVMKLEFNSMSSCISRLDDAVSKLNLQNKTSRYQSTNR